MAFAYGGGAAVAYPGMFTSGKTAGVATNFDVKIRDDIVMTNLSIKDPDEVLNSTKVAITIRDAQGKTIFDLPDGYCGADTVYNYDEDLPIGENTVLRITLTGPTATTPRIRMMAIRLEESGE